MLLLHPTAGRAQQLGCCWQHVQASHSEAGSSMPCGLLHATGDVESLPHLRVKGRHVLVLMISSPGCLSPHIDLGHDHIHDLQQEGFSDRFKLLQESCAAEV